MNKKLAGKFETVGEILILVTIGILVFTFWPVVKEEAKYEVAKITKIQYSVDPKEGSKEKKLTPPNTDFSIVIPKIGAVAPVIANIDSQNPNAFLPVLKKGVAHAKGTSLPGETGNTYLFAHSTDAFYNVSHYNAVFYLLGKLTKDDEIDIYYKGIRYIYKVSEVKVVEPNAVKYLGKIMEGLPAQSGSTLTLQTCYPPGTTLKRLVIIAFNVN